MQQAVFQFCLHRVQAANGFTVGGFKRNFSQGKPFPQLPVIEVNAGDINVAVIIFHGYGLNTVHIFDPQDTGFVNVEISSFLSRITNTEFKLDFMQMTPVTDKNKPRRLVAFFIDESGKKISFEVPIIANIRDKDASRRLITEKFTLRSGRYRAGQEYYLVLADMDDESKIHQKYKFTIDIADM